MAHFVGAISTPVGITSNFNDPENRNHLIYPVFGVCLSLSTFSVLLRLYTRFVITKRHGWEDYLLIVGWILAIVYFLMLPLGISIGAGIHAYDLTPERFMTFQKRSNLTDVFYNTTAIFVKLSIVFQIHSIFVPNRSSYLHYLLIAVSILTVCFYTVCFFIRIFQCVPREKIWNPSIEGHCINTPAAILSSAIFNIGFDFLFLVLPIRSIWKLNMSRKSKWGISSIFAVALFACLSSIMRTVTSISLLHSEDVTWNLIPVGVWCDAEITCGILCCCLPVFPQFYRHRVSRLVMSLRTRLATVRSSAAGNPPSIKSGPRPSAARRYPWTTPNGLINRNFIELSGLNDDLKTESRVASNSVAINTSEYSGSERVNTSDIELGGIMKSVKIDRRLEERQ